MKVLRTALFYYLASVAACFIMFLLMSLVEGPGSFPDVKVSGMLETVIILALAVPIAALRMMETTVFLVLPLVMVSWRRPPGNLTSHIIAGAVILLTSMLLIVPLASGAPWPGHAKWYEVAIYIAGGASGGFVYWGLNRFWTRVPAG